MAGKFAFFRLQVIDDCLNNKSKKYTIEDLIIAVETAIEKEISKLGRNSAQADQDEFTISRRTIDYDLKILRSVYGAPLNRPNHYERHYCYTEAFNLNGINVDSDEKRAFEIGLSFLKLFQNTEYAKRYKTILDKLINKNGDYTPEQEIIQIEGANGNGGLVWFDNIYNAIDNYHAIQIVYKPYNGQCKEWLVSPYLLKEYHNKWYIVGFNHNKSEIYTFGLDRIVSLDKVTDKKIKYQFPPLNFDRQSYFEHSLGITRLSNTKPLALQLKFNALNMHFVLSEPWHHSQKIIKQTDTSLTISISVYESHELNMKVLSYGDGIEVLKPLKYRNTIKEFIEKMRNIYQK
jgi:predicted DNA-binding transcriptional regulator YafY